MLLKKKFLQKSEKNQKHKITWFGTSVSKALDRKKFEKNANVDLNVVKAYCIGEEGRYKESNFTAIVPELVSKGGIDTLILQTGSIEITNIDVNRAMMDVTKDISEYKKEWFHKAEEDSKNLFAIAEDAITKDSTLNVIIVKRLPRFDRASKDILGIKSQLSKFANQAYDQLWLKQGSPSRIHIIELELGCSKSVNLKNLIYGKNDNPSYDGLHLVGGGALRHFTYRAVQAVYPIITKPSHPTGNTTGGSKRAKNGARKSDNLTEDQTKRAHSRYQPQSGQGRQGERMYSDVVNNSTYSVPTKNFYAPLNC